MMKERGGGIVLDELNYKSMSSKNLPMNGGH
jgi:hypothetical protein